MSAEQAAVVRTFRVGKHTVTLTIPQPTSGVVAMACEWAPTVPHRLTQREWRQYREGRDAAIVELCRIVGERAVLIEL